MLSGCGFASVDSLFFFFQAEDGIRDYKVTGVQTCALPIFTGGVPASETRAAGSDSGFQPNRRLTASPASTSAAARRPGGAERKRAIGAPMQIGRASCRGRGCEAGVAVALTSQEPRRSTYLG